DEVLQKKEWTRALRASLLRVGDAQKELGQETEQIAQEQLKQASVFEHLLTKSANAMQQAADKMQDLPQQDESADFSSKQTPLNPVALDTSSQEVQGFQRAASRRLDLLLQAIKPEPGVRTRRSQSNDNGQSGKGNPFTNGQGNDLPPIAQLKALRALQQELNDRTKDFVTQHPDPFRVTRRQFEELQVIHQEQQEMADLFDRLTPGSGKQADNQSSATHCGVCCPFIWCFVSSRPGMNREKTHPNRPCGSRKESNLQPSPCWNTSRNSLRKRWSRQSYPNRQGSRPRQMKMRMPVTAGSKGLRKSSA